MFDKDFYPTPPEVLDMIGIDPAGKIVLEPSAGSGNIIDWLKKAGVAEVIACEKHPDLSKIVKSKADKFLKHDFLEVTPQEISHIHAIYMNPPFSAGAKHILHAWTIAPGGCEIVSLVNSETLENNYSRERRELSKLIDDYGNSVDLGSVFGSSERSTQVEVSVIKLFKPSEGDSEFNGFFMFDEEEKQGNGIMEYSAVREIVQRYVNCVKKFEQIETLAGDLKSAAGPISCGEIVCKMGSRDNEVINKESFKKELQKNAWKYLFNKMSLEKYVTSGVMKDINKFVESQTRVPFTMRNVYRMFEIIVGTREETFNRSLVEAVDKFTRHTHKNRYNIEGWKTNAGHLLNQKFISPHILSKSWNDYLSPIYGHGGCYSESIEDLVKVLCSIEGENYENIPRLRQYCQEIKMQPNIWYDWGFFEIKGFLKGTMHLKFKSRDVWARINQRYAKIKGQVLPDNMYSKKAA